MAPNLEVTADLPKYNNDDDVVISGISGRFPHCETFEEFKQKLFDGTDILTEGESRWPDGVCGAVTKIGVIGGLSKFDSTFFNVHPKLADRLEPQIRIMLESTYEAFIDAGLNPTSMRGTNTGVVVATTNNDCADWWSADPTRVNGYEFLGSTRTMFPNRISYSFDLKGPSYAIDSGSSGSLLAFEHGYRMLKTGLVDGVVVAGCSLLLNPVLSVMLQKMDAISPEGVCKPFDASGLGFARSDAVVVVYMQLAKTAKRVYATAVNARTNSEGFRLEGSIFPTNGQQIELFKEVLEIAQVDPADVDYIESSACGDQMGDAQELNAVTEVYCKNRRKPLLIGSVKSNMGDGEPASGLCGVVKTVLAMENQEIPPTLHYNSPNPRVPALKDGRIQVVNKSLPWKGQYAAVNAVGLGGHNAHALLKSYSKQKDSLVKDAIPRLVIGSARNESAINYMLNRIEGLPRDPEFYGLLYGVQSVNIPGHNYRGYSILGEDNRETAVVEMGKRQVWFVFSGMGSQWTGMGRDLLDLPPFKESIEKSANVLKPLGLDLYAIFNSNDKTVFDNVLNSFVGIAAIQIALVDVLTTVGIVPDGIVGHSVGELACAYADRTLTAEQTMIVAYWRGRSLLDLKLPPGAMAAVGLSWEEANARVPSDIAVACHNSEDGVTISGPPDSISKFVNKLKSEGVFAREVNSSGVAFHSWYIAAAGPVFKEKVSGVISNPKPRSPKWISTSIPESRWSEPLAQFSSVAYHVNNLVSPVLFNSALKHVPDNSVVIEIAPHALLQAILKPSVGSKCTHIGLVRRNQSTVSNLLSSIGNLFNAGLQLKLENLYPPINYPVSRGTPSLQPLVEWEHSDDWTVISFIDDEVKSSGEVRIELNVENEKHTYLRGNYIDGVEVLPYASCLVLVWKSLAQLLQKSSIDELPVVFDNVQFFRTVPIPEDGVFEFFTNILAGTGEFEIRENNSVIASGFIKVQTSDEQMQLAEIKSYEVDQLSGTDIYQDLACKGYKYSKSFQAINFTSNNGNCGSIAFNGNWTQLLDSLLQLHLLKLDTRDHYAIKYLFKLIVTPEKQNQAVSPNGVSFGVYENIGVIKTAGVEIRDLRSTLIPIRKELNQSFNLESYTFVPYVLKEAISQPLDNIVQIVLENASESFDVTEVVTVQQELLVSQILSLATSRSLFPITANVYAKDINRFKSEDFLTYYEQDLTCSVLEKQSFFVITNGAIENEKLLNNLLSGVKDGGFLLTVEPNFETKYRQVGVEFIAKYTDGLNTYILLKKMAAELPSPVLIPVGSSLSWIESLKSNIKNAKNDNRDIVLISQSLNVTGVIGLTKGLRQEPNGKFVKCVSIKDNKAPLFSASASLFQAQLKKGLAVNMYLNGVWGTCVFVPYEQSTIEVEHAYINTTKAGDVNSLQFIEGKLSTLNLKEYPDYELCYPYYVPLNGLDVKLVNGTLPYNGISGDLIQQGSYLGMEFSGRNSSGKRVIGLVAGGALATSVLAHKDLIWQIPDEWSLEEACTIPRVYSLAYYALVVRGNIQPGESIYIHAGASGISSASVGVALELGATPYVGVSNKNQKVYLKSRYPQLNDDSFADLTDNGGFEQHILEQTEGRGVDLIFDTYSAYNKRQEFVNSLAEYGRLIDIEVFSPIPDSLGVSGNLKSITYNKISLNTIHFSSSEIKCIQQLISQAIKDKKLRPLSTTVFPAIEATQAFKYNANCTENLGRTVVEIKKEENESTLPVKKSVAALSKLFFSSEKSFVIIGDDVNLCLELIQFLASRGARKFILVSKNKSLSGYINLVLKRLKNKNVSVVISLGDPSTVKGTEDIFREALILGPISGIYYLSTAPESGNLQSLNENDFTTAKNEVSEVVANLDILSRKLVPQLEYFVVLAPSVASRGDKNKSNYVFANAEIFRIAEVRKFSGYPAVVVEYGAIEGSSNSFNSRNFKAASIGSALNILDNVTKQPKNPAVVSFSKYTGPEEENLDAATPILLLIAKVFGYKTLSEIEQTFTLAHLGLDTFLAPRVQKVIQQETNKFVEVEQLRLMTFPVLREKILDFLVNKKN